MVLLRASERLGAAPCWLLLSSTERAKLWTGPPRRTLARRCVCRSCWRTHTGEASSALLIPPRSVVLRGSRALRRLEARRASGGEGVHDLRPEPKGAGALASRRAGGSVHGVWSEVATRPCTISPQNLSSKSAAQQQRHHQHAAGAALRPRRVGRVQRALCQPTGCSVGVPVSDDLLVRPVITVDGCLLMVETTMATFAASRIEQQDAHAPHACKHHP